ncbi:MAG: polymorphic toxin-type HINT domain-containing protein [Zavarzinella sp.]
MRGQIIRTTAEHPFYVKDQGWVPAKLLQPGDLLQSEDQYLPLEGVADSGEVETVYNFCISDYHTYFVGDPTWGFSDWAHNAKYIDGNWHNRPDGTRIRYENGKFIKEVNPNASWAMRIYGQLSLNRSASALNPLGPMDAILLQRKTTYYTRCWKIPRN